jgi:hypothetical protein
LVVGGERGGDVVCRLWRGSEEQAQEEEEDLEEALIKAQR